MLGARNSSWFIKDPQSLLHSVKKTVLKSNFHYVYQDVFCLIFVTKIGASNSLIELRKIFKYLIKCCYRKRKLRKQNLGWQKGTEGPEKPEGKVTKRSAQEQMKTRLELFRAWRFTEEIKDSMVPLAEREGENEDGIGTWNARGPGEEWHFRCPKGTTESLSAFYSEPWSEGEKVNLSPFQGSGGSLL